MNSFAAGPRALAGILVKLRYRVPGPNHFIA